MVKTLSYLRADWKVEKVDLSDTALVDWFLEKNWSEERRRSQQVNPRQDSAIIPEITIQINRWTTLIIYVLPKGYKVKLSKDIVFDLAAKSTEAVVTSKSAVADVLQYAQDGASTDLAAKLRSIKTKESTLIQLKNVLFPLAAFLFFCYLGYFSYQDGETYQPIASVDELLPVEATLIHVNYQETRHKYKFDLYTAEYPVVFYLSRNISIVAGASEQSIENIISKLGSAPVQVHIPKNQAANLQQNNAEIPIYSLTLSNHEYITVQQAIKVDVAIKEEQAPFFAWFFPLQGFIVMFVIRYRLARNLFGGL